MLCFLQSKAQDSAYSMRKRKKKEMKRGKKNTPHSMRMGKTVIQAIKNLKNENNK